MTKERHIALVDDELSVRAGLERVLTVGGYHVLASSDGREAEQWLAEGRINCALLDVNLGDADGWELAQRLLAIDPLLPVIMISARPGQQFHPTAHMVDSVMEKPLDCSALLAKIAELVAEPASVQMPAFKGSSGNRE